tara:strand:- start:37400 stop:37726 length:327 start_codon:yes stop_codon:yes gene_type:complete
MIAILIVSFDLIKRTTSNGDNGIYKSVKTSENIVVYGKIDESIWQNSMAMKIDNFYDVEEDSDKQKAVFRMVWDDKNLYLSYECEDKYITVRETVQDRASYNDDYARL